MPLLGWALISANPPRYKGAEPAAATARLPAKQKYIMIWGAVPLYPIRPIQNIAFKPDGMAVQRQVHDRIVSTHAAAGYVMLALIVLHVLGALKHQLVDRHDALSRMGLRHPKGAGRRGAETGLGESK